MRVFFFFNTLSSTPTAASSNDQIQKFYFFPWRTWASDGLMKQFSSRESFTALSMNCITPPPPQLLFWDALRQRKHWRTDVALDFFLWPIYFVIKLFRDWDLKAEMLPCYIPANTAFS